MDSAARISAFFVYFWVVLKWAALYWWTHWKAVLTASGVAAFVVVPLLGIITHSYLLTVWPSLQAESELTPMDSLVYLLCYGVIPSVALATATFLICLAFAPSQVHYEQRKQLEQLQTAQASSDKVFAIRPLDGETLGRPPETDVFAKLAIKNTSGKLQRKVSVRMVSAFQVMRGELWDEPGSFPSVHPLRAESFLLRWSKGESATPDRKFLDIPCDGSERIADCLMLDRTPANRGVANFCAANPDETPDLKGIAKAWWKLTIRVAAHNGEAEDIELVATCSDRDPGPITLQPWSPRGDRILESERNEIAEKKQRKLEQERKEAERIAAIEREREIEESELRAKLEPVRTQLLRHADDAPTEVDHNSDKGREWVNSAKIMVDTLVPSANPHFDFGGFGYTPADVKRSVASLRTIAANLGVDSLRR